VAEAEFDLDFMISSALHLHTLFILLFLFPYPSFSSAPAGSSCNVGNKNPNLPQPDVFQSSGTLLLLIVGDGSAPLLPGVAAPLAIAEIRGTDGVEIQRIELPTIGSTLGKNLACTLATGMYSNKTWNWVDK